MSGTLQQGRLRAGVWEAVLTAAEPPEVEAMHQGTALAGLRVVALAGRPGEWLLRVPVPADRLDDGVQTFVIQTIGGEMLGHFTIVAGVPLEADLRAEIDLLRAELDLLKRAFRRHVRDGNDGTA